MEGTRLEWGEEDSCVTAQSGWVGAGGRGAERGGLSAVPCAAEENLWRGSNAGPPATSAAGIPREEEDPYGNYGGDAVGLLLFFNPRALPVLLSLLILLPLAFIHYS